MGWPRRFREGDRTRDTLRIESRLDEGYPPYTAPADRRERADSYWTWLVLGLVHDQATFSARDRCS